MALVDPQGKWSTVRISSFDMSDLNVNYYLQLCVYSVYLWWPYYADLIIFKTGQTWTKIWTVWQLFIRGFRHGQNGSTQMWILRRPESSFRGFLQLITSKCSIESYIQSLYTSYLFLIFKLTMSTVLIGPGAGNGIRRRRIARENLGHYLDQHTQQGHLQKLVL